MKNRCHRRCHVAVIVAVFQNLFNSHNNSKNTLYTSRTLPTSNQCNTLEQFGKTAQRFDIENFRSSLKDLRRRKRCRVSPPARPASLCSVVLAGSAPRGTLRVHRTPPSTQRHTPRTKVPLGCQQNERTGVIGRIFAYVQIQPAVVLAKESI